ncbi:Calcium-binding and coiled-coil domain-containing protein 2 [Cricetulus griseus]|uniref:Calcium-binding and coiled-coil domain-containing protein 2 n=1 Tax=Cricetulus griseus TaxID=10029 RepID=G3IBP6_CRIGR|nr:Calcium-binding and coiled-coil domain-containing protein 2 [Cricetulus griseus]
MKLEQTVENMRQKETMARKKQQELKDENFALSRTLSDKIVSDVLKKEKAKLERENNILKKEQQTDGLHGPPSLLAAILADKIHEQTL